MKTKQDRIDLLEKFIKYYITTIEICEELIKECSDEIVRVENEEEKES